ncbi:MAG: hypothetical protein HY579_12110 [Nitrospinae bacterium]|nr:hypothetical protein [Nitrospinota bacterium]
MNLKTTFFLIVLLLLAVSAVRNVWQARAGSEMAKYTQKLASANQAFMQCVMSNQDDITKCDELQKKIDEAKRKLGETVEKYHRALNIN